MNTREVNPFEDPKIANQWIQSIEGESRNIRDNELYPLLSSWLEQVGGNTILDLGSGQGVCVQCLSKDFTGTYIGVEPSQTLVDRAIALYGTHESEQFQFKIGNAYDIPLEDASVDTAFSVNVWFHLKSIDDATKELARVLKRGGAFHISTANPRNYDVWEGFYENPTRVGKLLSGKVNIPVQALDRNDFYLHSLGEIITTLSRHGLNIVEMREFGFMEKQPNQPLFVSFTGRRF